MTRLPAPVTAKQPSKLSWLERLTRKQTSPTKIPASSPLSDPEPQMNFTVEEVLQAVNIHKAFRLPLLAAEFEVVDLPAFDDLTQYDVTKEVQDHLWAAEVSRLVGAASGTAPLLFDGSPDFAIDSQRAHELLASVADRVFQAMSIAMYDTENLLAEEAKSLCNADELRRHRNHLEYIVDREEGKSEGHDTNLSRPRREDILNFVDYFSGVVARVLCTAADGKFMHLNTLAQMAKLCTKIKVLTANLPEFAQTSIDNGIPDKKIPVPVQDDLRGRQDEHKANNQGDYMMTAAAHNFAQEMDPLLEDMRQLSGIGATPSDSTRTKKDSVRALYFLHCHTFRRGLLKIFRFLLLSVRGTNMLSSTPIDSYEMSSTVYIAGFERFRVLLYQDHVEKSFLGSSDRDEVNYARISYHLLDKTIRAMKERSEKEGNTANDASVGTMVSWTYSPAESDGNDVLRKPSLLHLKSMSQVITIIVPLILTNPAAVIGIDGTVGQIKYAEDMFTQRSRTVKLRTFGNYTAFCCLTTKEYVRMQRALGPDAPRSLSNYLPRLSNLRRGQATTATGRTKTFPLDTITDDPSRSEADSVDDKTTLVEVERHQVELDTARKKMKAWVLEEKGVVVQCKLYVWSLMGICTLLVLGGVSVGAAVGERISGVDPFNITTYCWVLAAFILLVAKSVRVHDWSWNDFLHGRVLCKSVSELSAITGVNDQFIIAKLLQEGRQSILQNRGPFNSIFKRRSEDGFSIDCPLSPWTMMLSGLIMIEVESITGHALACLDLRQGTSINTVDQQHIPSDEDESQNIYCARLYKDDGKDNSLASKRIRLRRGEGIAWLRTLGLYSNKNVEFI